jgi:hypothetical protein
MRAFARVPVLAVDEDLPLPTISSSRCRSSEPSALSPDVALASTIAPEEDPITAKKIVTGRITDKLTEGRGRQRLLFEEHEGAEQDRDRSAHAQSTERRSIGFGDQESNADEKKKDPYRSDGKNLEGEGGEK